MARWIQSFAFALAGSVLAVTLTGCGGGKTSSESPAPETTASTGNAGASHAALGKVAYDRRMQGLGRRLAASVDGLFPLVEAQPGTEVSRESVAKLEHTRSVVTSVATDIASITPPAPVRAAHQNLLNGLATFGGELDELIRVLEKGTSRPFGEYTRFNGLRTIAQATKDIERKGYAIGS